MPLNSVDITVLARETPLANSISRGIGRGLQQSGAQLKQFEGELDRANKRVAAFAASASLLYGTVNAFKALVSESISVEKSLTSINSIFGLTGRELNSFSKDLFAIARQTGQSFDIAAKAAEEFSRQGLSVAETGKRTRDALLLVRLTGLDVTKAVDGLTAAMATFGKVGLDTTEILNKIVAADQKFAVSAKDIIDAFARTGNVVADAGASLEEFIGLVTAARQITSREGSVIGNSLKTIFTRLEREDTVQKLEALGVAVRDTSGETLKGYQVFQSLAASYKNLTREQQRYVDELGAGVFQINQFKAIVGDAAKVNGIAASAQRTAAGAVDEALVRNDALNKTMAASLQTLKTNATQAAAVIGKLSVFPVLDNLATSSSKIIESFFKATEGGSAAENFGVNLADGLLKGFGKVLEGPGLVFAGRILAGIGKKAFTVFGKDILETANFVSPAGKASILSREKELASLTTINSLLSQGTREEQARFLAAKAVTDQEAILLGILERQAAIQARLAGVPAPSFGARRTPKAAEGYLSSLGAERRAITQGVGGAPSSARAVFLPNFNRGDGQRGIVANTSEFYVPGAAGGAIYSRDMVKKYGLPPGSTPIAAGGYSDPSYYRNLGFGGTPQGSSLPANAADIAKINTEINGLLSSLKKAADLGTASKFGVQIQDLASVLDKAQQKDVGRKLAAAFPSLQDLKSAQISAQVQKTKEKIEPELVTRQKKLDEFNRRDVVASRVQQAFLLGTLGSGFIPAGTSGETSGQLSGAGSGFLQRGSLGAAAGSIFGPKGTIVGAGIGALFGAIEGFIDRSTKSFEELTIELEKANAKSAQQLDAVSQYITLQGNIKEAISNGATGKIIGSLERKQRALIPNIGSALERDLALAGSDENRLQEILAAASAEDSELRARSNLASKFNSLGKGFNPKDAGAVANTLFSSGLRSSNASVLLARIKAGEGEEDLTLSSDGVGTFNRNIEKNIKLKEDLRKEFQGLADKSVLDPSQKTEALAKIKEAALETLTRVFSTFAQSVDNSDIKRVSDQLKGSLEPLQRAFPRLLRENQNALELAGISGQGALEINSLRQRASLNLGDLTESQVSRRGSAFSVGDAQEKAKLSNFLSLEATRNSFLGETRQIQSLVPGLAESIVKATGLGDFEKITKNEKVGDPLREKLDGILQESRKTVAQNEVQISLAKEQARIDGFILEAQKNQRLLGSGTYSSDTNSVSRGLFDSLSVTRGAGRRKDQIDLNNYLTQIGLPQTDLSLSSDRTVRTQSVRDNLAQVLSARLRRNVGANDIESALGDVRGQAGDQEFVSRVREGLDNLKNYDPVKIREELLGGGTSAEAIRAAATAGDLSTGNLLLNKPLTSIEEYTKRNTEILERINENTREQADLYKRKDLEIGVFDTERQISRLQASPWLDPYGMETAELEGDLREKQKSIFEIEGRLRPTYSAAELALLESPLKKDRQSSIAPSPSASDRIKMRAFPVNENIPDPEFKDIFGTLSGGFRRGLETTVGPLDRIKDSLYNLRDVGEKVGQSLENNLSNAFGDFVTGAQKGKDAFRAFAVGVLNDSARAFASKAVQSLLGMLFSSVFGGGASTATAGSASTGSVIFGGNTGGYLGLSGGGGVPVALTGGEYLFSPATARNIGSSTLNAINSGSFQKKAAGGTIVRGGSGFKDDLFGRAPAGSFVVRKAMTERYGGGFLDSLAKKASSPYINGGFIGFTDGGSVGMMNPPSPTIIPGTGSGGSTSVNVGVTVNDNSTSSSSSASGGATNNRAFGEQLGQAVKQTVLEVLDQQSRVGGRLYAPTSRGR